MGAVLALAFPNIAFCEEMILSCDLVMDTQNKSPAHMDYNVNLDNQTVNNKPATINYAQISFQHRLDSGETIYTSISRMNGAITLTSSTLGLLATGTCVRQETHKF
jgi:hypothetical protein